MSRALNNPTLVRPDTAAKVKEVVKELNYHPNPAAQGLRSGSTRVITLVVKQKRTYDPLLFEFALGVSQTLREHGYSLLIHLTPEGTVPIDGISSRTDGVILTDIEEDDDRVRWMMGRVPLALFGESSMDIPQVDIDDVLGARMATEHLLSLGYQDIAMIAGDGRVLYMKNRIRGYIEAMRVADLSSSIAYGSLDMQGGELAMRSFGRLPEAVFCASDGMAVGVLKFLAFQKIRLPVVGCDGLQIGEITTPTLTSIRLPFYEAGLRLAEAIIHRINGMPSERILIAPQIVVRDSTWPKPDQQGHRLESG